MATVEDRGPEGPETKERVMQTHPDLMWELVRQRQIELGDEAAQRRRPHRGRHRRRAFRQSVED